MKRLLLMLALLCGVASGQSLTGSITAAGATCATTAACVDLQMPSGDAGSATILVTGTWVATLQFEASVDGITYAAINFTPPNSTTAVTSATANGTWQGNVAGYKNVRVRCSAFTSGTAVVTVNSSKGMAKVGGGGAVFASGGTTNNTIPKSNGSSALVDSTLVDNGTNVISTEVVMVPESASVAGVRGASNATGFAISVGNQWAISSAARFFGFSGTTTLIAGSGVAFTWSSNADPGVAGSDTFIRRRGAANISFGTADLNGTPVDQSISVQNAITGSNLPGGHFVIDAPLGTGTGATSKISINRALMAASGGTAQTAANAFAVGQSKTLSNTSATAQAIATITLGSNAGGGASGIFTLVCTDGTNFDSETQSFNVSFVNKATVVTVGTPAITTSTAANNSGSCTLGITAVANGNNIDLKVTPVFTTIVPTTVTLYPIITHSTNTVTFN